MNITIKPFLYQLSNKGYMAWEYNPFHNLRITDTTTASSNKILVYNIMLELTSMSKINAYIEDQWSKIYKDVYQNVKLTDITESKENTQKDKHSEDTVIKGKHWQLIKENENGID